ncbi:YggT family protein [Corynebacterium aquilae]|uniref:Membrane protein n=1 Tax=Corynebacterium aquilae DSM 44791 TaxID=1431546 RepID=A0A1L7CGX5_9CORY|nr:YggT family protein [Corynebacterium aquilae]APT85084.1 membrane protein [Corynebacterium aquilae DSM 44791]
MTTVISILIIALQLFSYILLGRIIVEMIASFSRDFRPPRWFALISEPLFIITDPPVRALRRLIPPVRMGNVGLDLSVMVLFLAIMLAQILLRTML